VTHQNKDKKIEKYSPLKDKCIFRDGHQGYDETAYPLKSPINAIRLLKSIASLKEGKIIETSLSELPHM
jgi:hypothetical protein